MRITHVTPIFAGKYLFVTVGTEDDTITGLGEAGCAGHLNGTAAELRQMGQYLIGRDPLHIEDHYQVFDRSRHFRGSVIRSAMSAIDIALWDIAGQHYGVPVHELFGGPTRTAVPAYRHAKGATQDDIKQQIQQAVDAGFRTVGHLSPWYDPPREHGYAWNPTAKHQHGIDALFDYRRQWPHLGLCVEGHRRSSVGEAVQFAHSMAELAPVWFEDPVRPDNLDEMAAVADRSPVPIATGERFLHPAEFAMVLQRRAAEYLRVAPAAVGGFTAALKIAGMAEAFGVQLAPHAPLSPVTTAVCLQLAAAVPNVVLQEYTGTEQEGEKRAIVDEPVSYDDDGHLVVPETPGIGIALDDRVDDVPVHERGFPIRRRLDGLIVDQ